MQEAAAALGGISHWTLRKHAGAGWIKVVRLGRRVFVDAEEMERIRREGLPSLSGETSRNQAPATGSTSDVKNPPPPDRKPSCTGPEACPHSRANANI
jgi:hypothetical protein